MRKIGLLSMSLFLLIVLVACNLNNPSNDSNDMEELTEAEVVEDGEIYYNTTSAIKEVGEEDGFTTLLVEGDNGDILVKVNEDTYINEEVNLEVGEVVEIQHTRVKTVNVPPEVMAVGINPEYKEVILHSQVKIKELMKDEDDTVVSLFVDMEGEDIIFHLDDNTKIEKGLELKEDMEVVIEYSDVFALSLPAQGNAISISKVK